MITLSDVLIQSLLEPISINHERSRGDGFNLSSETKEDIPEFLMLLIILRRFKKGSVKDDYGACRRSIRSNKLSMRLIVI